MPKAKRGHEWGGRPGKNKAPRESEEVAETPEDELERLRLFQRTLLQPITVAGAVYNLQQREQKLQLAKDIWLGGFIESLTALRNENPALVAVLTAQTANNYAGNPERKLRYINGCLLNAVRAQSQFSMPLVTAALSVLAECDMVPREFHDAIRYMFPGALATENWVDGFLTLARTQRPPPKYEVLDGVFVTVFDNLSMKMNYGSYVMDGMSGLTKHMTNWLTCTVPRSLAPPGFNARSLCAPAAPARSCAHLLLCAVTNGYFRNDLSLGTFSRQFYFNNPAVAAGRKSRWFRSMLAVKNGTHMNRPDTLPLWEPHMVYHPAIFDRLQSSYADVEHEMNVVRNAYPSAKFLFGAGDGLSLMRVNHVLANKPDVYLWSTPVYIPMQGSEHDARHSLFSFGREPV